MHDTTDDRLRALARAARAEVEAGLDNDEALAAVHARASTFAPEHPSTSGLRGASRNRTLVVLGAAATTVLVIAGAIWLSTDDDTITTTAATTLPAAATATATTLPVSLPATAAPIPASSAPSTTPPTDPPSTTTTTAPTEPVIPPGSIDLGPDDVVARAVDGDVWWYPGALGDAPADRILLIDRDDPRQLPEEGEGPNFVDHVAGTFEGSLVYSDCCEPVSGNVFAITEPGAEADLWSSPSGVSRTARLWGVGWEPRFEPGGTRVLASNWQVAQVTNLATGAADLLFLYDAGELGGLGAVWASDAIAVLGWSFDEGLVVSVRDADTLASEIARVVLAPPAAEVPAAGIVGATETSVVVFVRDDAGLARFITIETGSWTVADEPLGFDVPSDASEMHLDPDGNAMAWVVDGVGWVQRRGAAAVQIDDALAEVWIPEARGTATPAVEPGAVAAVDWRELPWEATRIGHSCVRASTICTRVIHDPDGTPISLDPNTRVLTRHGVPELTVALPDAYGRLPWLYHAGPDDVVYLQVDPLVPGEVAADLVAISLADGDAGRELGRWSDVVNTVGDSELVATPSGLVNVDCCGPEPLRPDPDAPVLVPWVDRSGAEVASTDPSIGTSVSPDLTITRSDRGSAGSRSWTIATPADWVNRGMPPVTPTFDGGFVAALPTGVESTIIVRGWPGGEVEQIRIELPRGLFTVSLDRSGRFLVGDGERMARVDPFADRTVRPAEQATVEVEAGTVTLPDLDDVTAEWVLDPVAFGDAVSGPLAVNEQRTITAEQRSDTEWLVTVTTSNFFDDSVYGVRWELTLERAADGRFSFVSGRWSNVCQPNRGHQDFQPALCV
jgi:hypothetical protein